MIRLKNISRTYIMGSTPVRALRSVSLTIEPGEFVAIMGPSGSGKSTLLHVLGFLDRPDSGEYYFSGKKVDSLSDDELASLRNHVAGFVFQQFHLLRRVTAMENTSLPLVYAGKKHLSERAEKSLVQVGLGSRLQHHSNELSGGEQQRVAIARSLVNDPLVLFADEPTGNLDTKSEEEIIDILKELNAQGKTIVMVTHEKEIAEHAKRIIFMRDGEIVSDEKKEQPGQTEKAEAVSLDTVLEQRHSSLGRIEFMDHLRQAMHAITSNKMRSFLSMLGILIGVAAVIAMLALGQGAKISIEERLKSLGSNLLSIRPGSHRVRGVAMDAGSVTRFTFSDAEALRELFLVKRLSEYVRGSGQTVFRDKNWSTQVEGVGYDYGEMRDSMPQVGRWFTRQEIEGREKVVILGLTVAEELFGRENPIGETIRLNRLNFKVIGILPAKGAGPGHDRDDVVDIPVTTAMYRVMGKDYIDSFYAEIISPEAIPEAKEQIDRLIRKRHRVPADDEDSFSIRDMSEIQETLKETTRTMGALLGAIAAISLVVGGIGIMNIMLVSVTERTREIGLRKAIGARAGDIMTQFLIEAVVMTFSGGLLGICLGVGTALSLSAFAGWTTKVSVSSIILATAFSVAVGIGFGLWPARKASRLNPVEALRYE